MGKCLPLKIRAVMKAPPNVVPLQFDFSLPSTIGLLLTSVQPKDAAGCCFLCHILTRHTVVKVCGSQNMSLVTSWNIVKYNWSKTSSATLGSRDVFNEQQRLPLNIRQTSEVCRGWSLIRLLCQSPDFPISDHQVDIYISPILWLMSKYKQH